MQSFYIPNSLECIISIIQNYEELLLNLHNEISEENEETGVIEKKSLSPTKMRQSSPSKILKESKMRFSELRMLKDESTTDQLQISKKSKSYVDLYDSYIHTLTEDDDIQLNVQWDLLSFFIMMIFQAEISINDKKNLLKFLNTSVDFNDNGVNMNQELIFKYLNIGSKKWNNLLFEKLLFEIETENQVILVRNEKVLIKLEDFFQTEKNYNGQIGFSNVKELKLIPTISSPDKKAFSKRKTAISLNGNYSNFNYLCDQFDFYSLMCNGRNHTWKKFLEEKIHYGALIKYLDADIEFGNFIILNKFIVFLKFYRN